MAQLYFYYSAMNAGKSTSLLQSAYNYQERGMRSVIFTAAIDDRYGLGKVSSRIGLSQPADLFSSQCDLFDNIIIPLVFDVVDLVPGKKVKNVKK